MKRSSYIIPGVLILLVLGAILLSNPDFAVASALRSAINASGAPTVISYQGQVSVDEMLYTGTGYFKFAVVDQAGMTTYWSNDGTSSGGSEPTAVVALTVSNGLFEVLLGDTSLENMNQALTAAVFDGTDRYLRVWFSEDAVTYAQLDPDQQFAAVPYALQAEEAMTTGDADLLDGQDSSAFQQRVDGSCSPGFSIRVIASDGTVTCEQDDGIVYTAGNQLSLNGTQFNVVEGSGSGLDADLLDGLQGSAYQQRVGGTCPTGSSIRVISSDGSVTCDTFDTYDYTRPVHDVDWVDRTDDVGKYTAITIGIDGLPIISYYDVTNTALKVAHCNDFACTGATISTVIGSGSSDKGQYSSIAIGSDGLPVIAYYDATDGELEVAHCENVACTSSTTTEVVTSTDAGRYTSITIGIDGLPLISYYDVDQDDLEVVHCSDITCSDKTKTTIDTGGLVGSHTSITIGTDGSGLISYYDSSNGNLKTAHSTNTACTSFNTYAIVTSGDVGRYTSITIGNDGLAVISYVYHLSDTDERVYLARCSNTACSSATANLVGYTGSANAAKRTAITIGSDGFPFIAYYDQANADLKGAHCNNAVCSSVSVQYLDVGTSAGYYPSVTIGMDGMPIISYYKAGSDDNLKIAHCSNAFCIPNVRR